MKCDGRNIRPPGDGHESTAEDKEHVFCPLLSRSIVAFKETSFKRQTWEGGGRLEHFALVAAGAHEPQLHGQLGVGVRIAGVQVAAGLLMLPWQAQLGHRLSQGGRAARRLAWHRRTTRLQPAGTAGRLIRDEQTDKKVE